MILVTKHPAPDTVNTKDMFEFIKWLNTPKTPEYGQPEPVFSLQMHENEHYWTGKFGDLEVLYSIGELFELWLRQESDKKR